MTYQGVEYLKNKLAQKQSRINLRYNYYEMKKAVKDFNIVIPKEWSFLTATLGWCAKAVDALADRIVFREFANDNFDINSIFRMNSRDVLVDSAILSACIASCSFVYISADQEGYPRLQVIDAYDATGIIDTPTMLLEEGYAVLERDVKTKKPVLEAWFTKEETVFYDLKNMTAQRIPNPAPYPLLVPIIFRPDARRPFGHSRISRACMDIMQSAMRTMKRAEITEEFYSFPQKYITGLSPDAEMIDKWKATISSFLQFTKDEEGDHPILGQFTTQSVTPHIEHLRMCASNFSGETGLTMDDLGFPSENPSSASAIRATHESLLVTARNAQRKFGVGLLNVGYLAACVRDDYPYLRRQFYLTEAKWEPVFEPDASQIAGIGDAANKIQQSFPDYFTEEKLHDLTGI